MHKKLFALLAVASLLVAFNVLASAGDAKAKDDQKTIQGTWTMMKGDEKARLTFTKDKFTLEFMGKTVMGTFKLDPTKKPATIDMTVTKGSDADTQNYEGKTSLGIYAFDGDKLKWLAPQPGKDERPKAFPVDDEKPKGLYGVFSREKK